MLVLTRKPDETILIGDNIKITLLRIRGNSVRIGIEAPREVRVVRGELDSFDSNSVNEVEFTLSDREQVFAPSQAKGVRPRLNLTENRLNPGLEAESSHRLKPHDKPQIFVGRVRCGDGDAQLSRAPLAGFMSAT